MSHNASVVGGGEDIVGFSVFKKALKQMNSPLTRHLLSCDLLCRPFLLVLSTAGSASCAYAPVICPPSLRCKLPKNRDLLRPARF